MWLASLLCAALSFEQIVAQAGEANRAKSLEQMGAWVAANPRDPQAPRGLLWMAQLSRNEYRNRPARELLERILRDYGATEWAHHAQQGLAELDLIDHQYASATARYQALAQEPSRLWSFIGRTGEERARGERWRFRLLLAVVLGTLGLAALRIARAGLRSLWPPPTELIYAAPILLVTLLAAPGQEHDEARAVVTMALGGAALLWLNGAWLRARRGQRLAQAALGVAQAAGLVYCALVWNGLWAKLIDTIAMGAE